MESSERDAFSRVCLKEDSRKLYALLRKILTERERTVLVMRYGLYNGREYTQREVAAKLGISRSYISRIEKNALLSCGNIFLRNDLICQRCPVYNRSDSTKSTKEESSAGYVEDRFL